LSFIVQFEFLMTTQGNVQGLDELGQEVLWSSLGQQVMMRWEKQYMERCVEALGIGETAHVLEIGFGLAYSASHIQTFRPVRHTIVECDQETLQRARQFAASHEGVEIVAGTWQQQLPTLGQFDCVFFDDYPLPELESGDLRAVWGSGGEQR
jgi:guanidinoacetate N-methyltransferase